MVLAGVSWKGKQTFILLKLVEPRLIVKVTFSYWMATFSLVAKNFILETITCQQDGSSFLTSGATQAHLEEATPEFLKRMNGLRKVLAATLWIVPSEFL